jgi:hypothetical protein
MSLSSISSTSAQQVWQILTTGLQTESGAESGIQTITTGTETSVDFSDPGKLFSKLQQLSESDPEKFKAVMSDIAEEIKKAADSTSDENESSMLTKISEDFQKAAESGDLSEALPKGSPPPGPPPSGSPPNVSGSATRGRTNGYAQKNMESDGFSTVLNIIEETLEKNNLATS